MKTAVQQVFSDLEEMHPNLFNVYTTEGKEFINHFHKYLAMEKEQIIDFADSYGTYLLVGGTMSAASYNETFNPEANEPA